MSTTRYFTPIDAEGLQQFVQGVEPDGWYQFDRVGISVPALPGITIPQGATGLILQAVTDMRYCLSPTEAQAGTGAFLTLPAGGYLELPGTEALEQFCVYLDSTVTTFTVAFLFGSIGPMPWIHQPSTGGIIPPPPPGIGAIPTINAVHVMKNAGGNGGNDATGTRNRLDLPFLTTAAAEAAMQEGDKMVIWPGLYQAENLGALRKACDFVLIGATIEDTGSGAAIFSVADSGNQRITGNGLIWMHNGGDIAIDQIYSSTLMLEVDVLAENGGDSAIRQIDANAELYFRCNIVSSHPDTISSAGTVRGFGTVTSSGIGTLSVSGGTQIIHGSVTNTAGGTCLSCDGGTQVFYGPVAGGPSAVVCYSGNQQVHGTIVGDEDADAVSCTNGIQEITGNVSTTGTGRAAVMNGTGQQIIRGNLSADSIAANMGAGLQVIYGNVTSTGARAAYMNGTGRQEIHGRVYSAASWGANCQAGTQVIYGDCISDGAGQAGAECNNGTQVVHGQCTGTANSIGANMNGTGTQVIFGNCSSATNAGARCDAGTQTIYGDCTSTSGWGHFAGGGTSNLHGMVSCSTTRGAFARASAIVRYMAGITTGSATAPAIEIGAGAAPALELMGGAYLKTGGGKSIQDPLGVSPTVRSYGAYANNAVSATVTIAGTLTVLP